MFPASPNNGVEMDPERGKNLTTFRSHTAVVVYTEGGGKYGGCYLGEAGKVEDGSVSDIIIRRSGFHSVREIIDYFNNSRVGGRAFLLGPHIFHKNSIRQARFGAEVRYPSEIFFRSRYLDPVKNSRNSSAF